MSEELTEKQIKWIDRQIKFGSGHGLKVREFLKELEKKEKKNE